MFFFICLLYVVSGIPAAVGSRGGKPYFLGGAVLCFVSLLCISKTKQKPVIMKSKMSEGNMKEAKRLQEVNFCYTTQ